MNIVLRETLEGDLTRVAAKERAVSVCRRLEELFEWFRRAIGTLYFTVYQQHAATMAAYFLLDYLRDDGIAPIFHTMIIALSAVSQRWTISRGVLRMLWITIKERKLEAFLEVSTLTLLRLSAVDNWSPQDHRLFESCVYPNYAAIKEDGRNFADMGELLHKYSLLELQERHEDASGV